MQKQKGIDFVGIKKNREVTEDAVPVSIFDFKSSTNK